MTILWNRAEATAQLGARLGGAMQDRWAMRWWWTLVAVGLLGMGGGLGLWFDGQRTAAALLGLTLTLLAALLLPLSRLDRLGALLKRWRTTQGGRLGHAQRLRGELTLDGAGWPLSADLSAVTAVCVGQHLRLGIEDGTLRLGDRPIDALAGTALELYDDGLGHWQVRLWDAPRREGQGRPIDARLGVEGLLACSEVMALPWRVAHILTWASWRVAEARGWHLVAAPGRFTPEELATSTLEAAPRRLRWLEDLIHASPGAQPRTTDRAPTRDDNPRGARPTRWRHHFDAPGALHNDAPNLKALRDFLAINPLTVPLALVAATMRALMSSLPLHRALHRLEIDPQRLALDDLTLPLETLRLISAAPVHRGSPMVLARDAAMLLEAPLDYEARVALGLSAAQALAAMAEGDLARAPDGAPTATPARPHARTSTKGLRGALLREWIAVLGRATLAVPFGGLEIFPVAMKIAHDTGLRDFSHANWDNAPLGFAIMFGALGWACHVGLGGIALMGQKPEPDLDHHPLRVPMKFWMVALAALGTSLVQIAGLLWLAVWLDWHNVGHW